MSDIISTTSLVSLDPDSFVDLFEIYVPRGSGVPGARPAAAACSRWFVGGH